MWIFSRQQGKSGKDEAIICVQKHLEAQRSSGLGIEYSAALAEDLVADVWQRHVALPGAASAGRPHKLVLAALALARGLVDFPEGSLQRTVCLHALADLLRTADRDSRSRPFSDADQARLTVASEMWREALVAAQQAVPA